MRIDRRTLLAMLGQGFVASLTGCARHPALAAGGELADQPSTGDRLALLIGCTNYPHLTQRDQLIGPGNDVVLFKKLLLAKYHFREPDITVLSEEEGQKDPRKRPTRANIQREFEELGKKKSPAVSQVVILLGGHGSRQPDRRPNDSERFQPDGLEEVFLPADAEALAAKGESIRNAIEDWEFRDWLKEIRKTGAHVWVVADCCHSASIVRGLDDEVAREIPAEELISTEALARAKERARQKNTEQSRGGPDESLTFKVPPDEPDLVALYAAQATEPTFERWLPPESAQPVKHGLLTYTLCQVLEKAENPLTYTELLQEIHTQYRAWDRTCPTPLVEGKDRYREVLGDTEHRGRSRILLDRDGGHYYVDAGALHGLTADSILVVYPSAKQADATTKLGHVRVTKKGLQTMTAAVEPCAYADMEKNTDFPKKGRCELVSLNYGDLRLKVAVDAQTNKGVQLQMTRSADDAARDEMLPEDRRQRLLAELKKAAQDGKLFQAVDRSQRPGWLLRYDSLDSGKLYLVPAAGYRVGRAGDMADLPPLFGPVPEGEKMGPWLTDKLGRIARVENLLKITGASRGAVDATGLGVKVQVELLRLRDKNDTVGAPILLDGKEITFRPGDRIGFRVRNVGPEAADVNLLFVDSGYGITAFFPRSASTDNRLRPQGKPILLRGKINQKTVGVERLVVIAVKATDVEEYANFSFLEQPTLERARSVGQSRGATRGIESPLGRLLQNAAYGHGSTRGLQIDDDPNASDAYAFDLLSWRVAASK
jgi:hypothetical protein